MKKRSKKVKIKAVVLDKGGRPRLKVVVLDYNFFIIFVVEYLVITERKLTFIWQGKSVMNFLDDTTINISSLKISTIL